MIGRYVVLMILLSFPACSTRAREDIVLAPQHVQLGEVQAGTETVLEFTVSNTGSVRRTLFGVQTSCDCETIESNGKRISTDSVIVLQSGERKTFRLRFSVKAGQRTLRVVMPTDSESTPSVNLTAHVIGKEKYRVQPQEVNLGVIRLGEKYQFRCSVTSDSPFDLLTGDDGVQLAKLSDKEWEVAGTVAPDREGAFLRAFVLDIARERSTVGIKVFGDVPLTVLLDPSIVAFGRMRVGEQLERRILVKRGEGDPRVTSVRIGDDDLVAEGFLARVEGDEIIVVAEVHERARVIRGTLIVEFSDGYPRREVPLFGVAGR